MSKPTSTEHVQEIEGATQPVSRAVASSHAVSGNRIPPAQTSGQTADADAFAVLEALTGSIEAPEDWAAEHDHYLYGTPKRGER